MYFLLVSDVMDVSLWAQRSWVLSKGSDESHCPQEEGEDRELTRGINQLQNFPGANKRSMQR